MCVNGGRGRCPFTVALPEAIGKAPPHGAASVPVPRVADVLLHGVRHLRFLVTTEGDAETAAARGRELASAPGPAQAGAGLDVQRTARRVKLPPGMM